MKLLYEDKDFLIVARKAIAAGEVFSFEMRGDAWDQLRAHVVDESVPQWAALVTTSQLQGFVGVMMLAGVWSRAVRVISFDEFAEVRVGSTH